MTTKTCIDDMFVRRVLLCIDEQKLTLEEIHAKYLSLYPPAFNFLKTSVGAVGVAVGKLLEENYLLKEVTRFTDQPLDKDTNVYHISRPGRDALSKKKRF